MAGGLAEAARWFVVTTAELVALFLALSFLVGLLQAWLPEEKVRSLFERRSRPPTGYLLGASLGAVTPFCSYSTIPVLAGLLRSGAPFGPAMAFLFASPLLDPVVLGVLVFLVGVEGTDRRLLGPHLLCLGPDRRSPGEARPRKRREAASRSREPGRWTDELF
jgi:uncharacterized protein